MTTFITPEQFVVAGKANVETLLALTNANFARAERLVALNLNTARSVLEDGVANAKALLAAKDVQAVAGLQAGFAQPLVDKAVAYGRSVYEIAAEGQQEIVKLVEAQVADLNKAINEAVEKAAKSAPAGSEAAFAAVKSVIAVANDAYANVAKAAKQVAEAAETNVAAATEAAVKAVSAPKAAKKAA